MSKALDQLEPAERFMYEFGCFVTWWGNFEMLMEFLIWKLRGGCAIDNCKAINRKTAGEKRRKLRKLLQKYGQNDAITALDRVFEVAERNAWIHGTILNPKGDFSVLTRFRGEPDKTPFSAELKSINMDRTLFFDFYKAYDNFVKVSGIDMREGNRYIATVIQACGDES